MRKQHERWHTPAATPLRLPRPLAILAGEEAEAGAMTSPYRFACPHCKREFPYWYWGVTGKAGGLGTVKKPGLARANFGRHVEACQRKTQEPPKTIGVLEALPCRDWDPWRGYSLWLIVRFPICNPCALTANKRRQMTKAAQTTFTEEHGYEPLFIQNVEGSVWWRAGPVEEGE